MEHSNHKRAFLIGAAVLAALVGGAVYDTEAIEFESKESKTINGNPIFNRIKWWSSASSNVWMMQQSHHGTRISEQGKDLLAIVIDKTVNPHTAQFYQLEPGRLEWTGGANQLAPKTACFLCHPNEPRVIRPNWGSALNPATTWDRLRLALWNTRGGFKGDSPTRSSRERKTRCGDLQPLSQRRGDVCSRDSSPQQSSRHSLNARVRRDAAAGFRPFRRREVAARKIFTWILIKLERTPL